MKKLGLLALALVVALGGLGIGYAAWTDEVTVTGTVDTGELCFSIKPGSINERQGCPDLNWSGWIKQYNPSIVSCPTGYVFDEIFNAPEGKCPATVELEPIIDGDHISGIEVTIYNAYPHFVADIGFWLCNCGTIPLKIKAPTMSQNDFLLIQYGDNIGAQLHPGNCVEVSFYVGVVQHEGYWLDDIVGGTWIVDDPTAPLLPMDEPLTFIIEVEGIQWNEY